MDDQKNQTETIGPLEGPFTLTCSGTFTMGNGGLIITGIKEMTDWICPECHRTFHKNFKSPDCPICKVALTRIVELS